MSQSSTQDGDHVEKLALGSKCNGKTPKGFDLERVLSCDFHVAKTILSSTKHRVEGPRAE